MSSPVRPVILIGALTIANLSLAACNDADQEQGRDERQTHVVSSAKPTEVPVWLTTKDKMDPATWLRSREVGHEVLPADPEVDRIRRGLHQAESRFYEDPRMIANRTEQTGEILAQKHAPERYVDILTGMIDVADASAQKKLYGELVQHYINLRQQGIDRTGALQQLSAAYGDREENRKN